MQREIKFRAWDSVDYMSNPFTLQDIQQKKIEFGVGVTLLQFAGLKDNNGKEIYEGNVYRDEFSVDDENGLDERIYFVCIFFKPLAAFCWISTDEYNLNPNGDCWDKSKEYPYTLNEDEMHKITIIGNIFESPNLLKQK